MEPLITIDAFKIIFENHSEKNKESTDRLNKIHL